MEKPDRPNTEFDSPCPTYKGLPAVDPNVAAEVAATVERAKKDGGIITDYAEAMNIPEVRELMEKMKGIDQKREKSLMIVLSLLKKIKATEQTAQNKDAIDDEDTLVDNQPFKFAPTNKDWSAALKAIDDTGAFECLSEPIDMAEDEAVIIDSPPKEDLIETGYPEAVSSPRPHRPTREDLKAVVINHEAKHGQLKMTALEKEIYRELIERFSELSEADKKEVVSGIDEKVIKAKIIKILAEGRKVKTAVGKAPLPTAQSQAEKTRAETRQIITVGADGFKMEVVPK